MPMATFGRFPAAEYSITVNTTAPVATTYAAAKLEAHGYAPAGDGLVTLESLSAKSVTAYYYSLEANKWKKAGSVATKHTVSWLADCGDTWAFPAQSLVRFVIDAGSETWTTSAKPVT